MVGYLWYVVSEKSICKEAKRNC